MTLQVCPPPVGSVEVKRSPLASNARHSVADGHATDTIDVPSPVGSCAGRVGAVHDSDAAGEFGMAEVMKGVAEIELKAKRLTASR